MSEKKIPPKEEPAPDDALFRQIFGGEFFKDLSERMDKAERGHKIYAATPTFRIVMIDEASGKEIARLSKLTAMKVNAYQKDGRGYPNGITYALSQRPTELAALCHLEPFMLARWLQGYPEVVEIMKNLPPAEQIVEWRP